MKNLETISDLALMQLIKSGDIDKLAILYERYKKPLFSYFIRLSGNRERSEDMVQTVFYRILKAHKQFRAKSKFTTWMFSIAHNVLVDSFKKRENKNLLSDMTEFENKETGTGIIDEIEKKEQIELLKIAMKKLSIDKREPLVLSRYEGMKYKEIAKVMGLSESAVKVRVFRAIEELRQIYLVISN
ncbi:MAG: hypothetical protein B6I20_07720 [Bacteroidetes bacterium 4572_117]|nr:MAG: hypothetical protein B6I20_07720 [Bacteroidetes bacterium 4572_117]